MIQNATNEISCVTNTSCSKDTIGQILGTPVASFTLFPSQTVRSSNKAMKGVEKGDVLPSAKQKPPFAQTILIPSQSINSSTRRKLGLSMTSRPDPYVGGGEKGAHISQKAKKRLDSFEKHAGDEVVFASSDRRSIPATYQTDDSTPEIEMAQVQNIDDGSEKARNKTTANKTRMKSKKKKFKMTGNLPDIDW